MTDREPYEPAQEYRGYEPGTHFGEEDSHSPEINASRDRNLRPATKAMIFHLADGTIHPSPNRTLTSREKRMLRVARMHVDPEFRKRERRKERVAVGCAVGSIALVMGATITGSILADIHEGHQPPSESLNPNDRYVFDYLTPGKGGSECFENTAYDLTAGSQGKMSVTPPSASYNAVSGVITITPPSGENPLHLDGLDQFAHTLSPVSELDESIFDSYGCEVENY